jgi:hypothetical protein
MQLIERVQNLVALGGASSTAPLAAADHEAILEIAYLAIAADRTLRDEELAAFRGIAERLRALRSGGDVVSIDDQELNGVLDRFCASLEGSTVDERARAVAVRLRTPEERRLAYKLAYALSVCDLDASEDEFQLDLTLLDALELSNDDAEQLTGEVDAALTAD